ncbi:MAG: PmoA family protein [Armatimonadota bacterium]
MTTYRIPLELDLASIPALSTESLIDVDLALVAAHAGYSGRLAPEVVSVTLPDGRPLPCQPLPEGRLLLSLGALTAAEGRLPLSVLIGGAPRQPGGAPRVVFSQGTDDVELLIDGLLIARYRYNTADPDLPRPYFHPILGPTGVPITQDGEIPGKREAHFHHTGVVVAHQNFTDGNNWQIGPNHSRMRHLGFTVMQSGPLFGRFVQRLEWPSVQGDRVVFTEVRTVTVPAREPARRCLDVETVITCGERPAVWNATPYHLLALRVPDAMTVASGGVITNSEGKKNSETAGARAKWLDFSGNLNGACGAAIFDHPENLRHPIPWLNFENETVGAAPTYHEPYAWQPEESRRFRYRVYFHAGDVQSGRVAEEYAAWTAAPSVRVGPPARIA